MEAALCIPCFHSRLVWISWYSSIYSASKFCIIACITNWNAKGFQQFSKSFGILFHLRSSNFCQHKPAICVKSSSWNENSIKTLVRNSKLQDAGHFPNIAFVWSILEIASWMYPVPFQTESGVFSIQAARPDPVKLDGGSARHSKIHRSRTHGEQQSCKNCFRNKMTCRLKLHS